MRVGQLGLDAHQVVGALVPDGVVALLLDHLPVHELHLQAILVGGDRGFEILDRHVVAGRSEEKTGLAETDREEKGRIDEASARLVQVTRECLDLGIAAAKPGREVREIGRAIQSHAEGEGYGVVRAFVGHGIAEQFHTDLQIPHYDDPRATTVIEPGMTFTIEPMITMGAWQHEIWDDNWTAVTIDRKRTAQFEHTLVVTDDGVEILTTTG